MFKSIDERALFCFGSLIILCSLSAFGSRCNLSIRPLLSADLDFRCSSTSSLVLMKYEDVAAKKLPRSRFQ